MKIVHAVYSLEMGGAEMLVSQLCRLQRAAGHQVSVCVYSQLGTLGEMLQADGIPIRVLGVASLRTTMFRYLQHFRRERPDVVHCHNPAPAFQAALGARLAGVRSIVVTRHSLVAPPYDLAAERNFNLFSWALLDWVAGICESTCENLRGTPLARKARIVRVYNGAAALDDSSKPLDKVSPQPGPPLEIGDVISAGTTGLSQPPRSFTLIFAGRLEAVKSLSTLLQAVAIAVKRVPGLHLWIVGDGSLRADLEALTEQLQMRDHINFWGQQARVDPFFAAADALAMSSISEGLPMSLLQAMSIGLPAILTQVGGMREVIQLSHAGLLVPVGDVKRMADAIVTLANDEHLHQEFCRRARSTFEAYFTLEHMASIYEALYQGVPPPRALPASL